MKITDVTENMKCDCCPDTKNSMATKRFRFSVYGDSVYMCDKCFESFKSLYKSIEAVEYAQAKPVAE